jgi:hypothetical protein
VQIVLAPSAFYTPAPYGQLDIIEDHSIMRVPATNPLFADDRRAGKLAKRQFITLITLGLFRLLRTKRLSIRRSTKLLITFNLIIIVMFEIGFWEDSLNDSVSLAYGPSQHLADLSKSETNNIELPSIDVFDVISDRPLLVPERRMPTLPIIESEPFVIKLVGTYLDDMERTALVKLGDQDNVVWVRKREFISGWQVEEIYPDRLLLRRADELRFVHLWPDRSPAQGG